MPILELTGSRMSNVYSITIPNRFSFDPNDQQVIYYVCEKISCEMAWLKTSGRKLCFRVLNAETGGTLALLTRPCKPCFCLSNIFVCCSTQVALLSYSSLGKNQWAFKQDSIRNNPELGCAFTRRSLLWLRAQSIQFLPP